MTPTIPLFGETKEREPSNQQDLLEPEVNRVYPNGCHTESNSQYGVRAGRILYKAGLLFLSKPLLIIMVNGTLWCLQKLSSFPPSLSLSVGVRQRRPPQTPHPALQHRPAPMATPQTVPRANPRPVPLVTPARPNVTTGTGPHALGTVTMPAVTQLPPPPLQPTSSAPSMVEQYVLPPGMCAGSAPGPPNPCPILPRERSGMDKVESYRISGWAGVYTRVAQP